MDLFISKGKARITAFAQHTFHYTIGNRLLSREIFVNSADVVDRTQKRLVLKKNDWRSIFLSGKRNLYGWQAFTKLGAGRVRPHLAMRMVKDDLRCDKNPGK